MITYELTEKQVIDVALMVKRLRKLRDAWGIHRLESNKATVAEIQDRIEHVLKGNEPEISLEYLENRYRHRTQTVRPVQELVESPALVAIEEYTAALKAAAGMIEMIEIIQEVRDVARGRVIEIDGETIFLSKIFFFDKLRAKKSGQTEFKVSMYSNGAVVKRVVDEETIRELESRFSSDFLDNMDWHKERRLGKPVVIGHVN